MSMLNVVPSYSRTPAAVRRATGFFLSTLRGMLNHWVSAIIARRECQANLVALRRLSDRDLRDIGLYRCQLDHGLPEAAKVRLRAQQSLQDR